MMANYTKKAVKGLSIVFMFIILSTIFAYLVRLVLARNLTVEEYGLFYSIFALLVLLSSFRDLGLNQALVKYIPEFLVKKKKVQIKSSIIFTLLVQLLLFGIISVALYFLSGFFAASYFRNPMASQVLLILAVYFILYSLEQVIMFTFQGFQRPALFSSIEFVRMLLILIVTWTGFIYYPGNVLVPAFAYLISTVGISIAYSPILLVKVFPEFMRLRSRMDNKLFKRLLYFGIPVTLAFIGASVLGQTDTIMLTYFVGLELTGLYNIALPTAKLIALFGVAISQITYPLVSELWARKHIVQLTAGIRAIYKYSIILILPLALIFFSFPELIISVIFGPRYLGASIALKILSVGFVFFSLAVVNFWIFSGIGQPKTTAKIVLIATLFNVALNFLLIPLLGIVGAAITTVGGHLLMLLLSVLILFKKIKLDVPISDWAKTLAAGLIFLISIWFLKKVIFLSVIPEAIVVVVISGIIYVAALFIFKALRRSELAEILQRTLGK